MATTRTEPSIQCSTGPFWTFSLEVAMDLLAEAGFTQIELMVTRDPRTHDPEIPGRIAAERGLEIASVHGPFLVISRSVWGLDPIGKIRRGVEMCRSFGATNLIVHPPYLWEQRYARWIRAESEGLEERTGVAVSVETMYPVWVAGRRVRAYRWLDPRQLAAACPRVAMDTSHLAVSRLDILDAYRVLEPKLTHLHLSDNAGDGRDGHLELESGVLPIDRLLDEMRRTGFSGGISLELGVRSYAERPKDLVAMLKRNRDYITKRLERPRRRSKGMPRMVKS